MLGRILSGNTKCLSLHIREMILPGRNTPQISHGGLIRVIGRKRFPHCLIGPFVLSNPSKAATNTTNAQAPRKVEASFWSVFPHGYRPDYHPRNALLMLMCKPLHRKSVK
jgi:hypothetical protein